MIRSISVAILALGLTALAFPQSTLTVTPPITVVPPGTLGAIQIVLSTPTTAVQPVALQFTIAGTVDTGALSAVVGPAAATAGKQISCTGSAPKTMLCIVWGLNSNPIPNGDVADITVPILPAATLATDAMTLSAAMGASAAGTALTMTVFPGSISVFNPCDLNRDGLTDIADVNLVVAQAIAGGTSCTTGNLTKDTKCDVLDVYREVLAAMPVTPGVTGSGICRVGQ